ncbi:spore coat protein GerQ [Gottfriedia luciferensis]|uniref:spore coat protein GerQ n=1 Tax=Gottfriedia luciferensis TaxID=178774 RepID=UPI001F285C6C|nr:spore coat protein GerQ [Gottfriedia luciferensis]
MSNPFEYYPNIYRQPQPTTPHQGQQTGQGQGLAASSGGMISQQGQVTATPGLFEQSYVENILRSNRGKIATVYMTFTGHQQQVFVGYVMGAGRDHIVLRDVNTTKTYILLTIYLDYVTFDEEIALPYQL